MKRTLAILSIMLASAGCSSRSVRVAMRPPADYRGGPSVSGSACGLLLWGIIPAGCNSRAQRAYAEAVEGADATGLTDTKITDRWAWVFVGEKFCTIVHGNGYRVEHAPPAAH